MAAQREIQQGRFDSTHTPGSTLQLTDQTLSTRCLDFTNRIIPQLGRNSFSFFDPPYIENGDDRLCLNNYDIADHITLVQRITRLRQPWVVTYDEAALA